MKDTDWIDHVEPDLTPDGGRLDLRLHVHPDGGGSIVVTRSESDEGQPVASLREAVQVFQELWKKASGSRNGQPSLNQVTLSEMLERVTADNVHVEVATAGPVGNEVW